MPNAPRLENGLTVKQNDFVNLYIMNGGDGHKAVVSAGYSEKGASVRAYELLHREDIQALIRAQSEKQTSALMPMALGTVKALMVSAKSESVRLAAAQDILNRAGLRPMVEQQGNQSLTTKAQYNAILDEIHKALQNREKTIESEGNEQELVVNA